MVSGDLRGFVSGKRHELSVSTYQIVILLLYNTSGTVFLAFIYFSFHSYQIYHYSVSLLSDVFTFRELHQQTQILVPDLKRNLLALCANPNVRILTKVDRKSTRLNSSH